MCVCVCEIKTHVYSKQNVSFIQHTTHKAMHIVKCSVRSKTTDNRRHVYASTPKLQ